MCTGFSTNGPQVHEARLRNVDRCFSWPGPKIRARERQRGRVRFAQAGRGVRGELLSATGASTWGDQTALRCRKKHHPRRSSKPVHVIGAMGSRHNPDIYGINAGENTEMNVSPSDQEVGLSLFRPGQDFPFLLPQTCDSYFSTNGVVYGRREYRARSASTTIIRTARPTR